MDTIMVMGSYNLDLVLRVDRFPQPGETLAAQSLRRFHGGKGSNQAVAAARAGARVVLRARVGADAAGAEARALWAAENIAAEIDVDAALPTGLALILVDAAGENQIVIVAGANGVPAAPGALPPGVGLVLAQLETPIAATGALFATARRAGARTLLNVAPASPLPDGLLALVDVVIANAAEAAALGGPAALLAAGPGAVVVTHGADGARLHRRDVAPLHQPALAVAVVDSTGAGDAFAGSLAAAMAAGADLPAALRQGVAAGAAACRVAGAVPSLPDAATIAALEVALPAAR
jgi:ribokinase